MKRERPQENQSEEEDVFVVFPGNLALELVSMYLDFEDRVRLALVNKRLYTRLQKCYKIIAYLRQSHATFKILRLVDFTSIIAALGHLEALQYFLKRILPTQYAMYLPVAASYKHIHLIQYLLTLIQATDANISVVFEMFMILIQSKEFDQSVMEILLHAGSWCGDHGEAIVKRCWIYATRICNDNLRVFLTKTFTNYFPSDPEVYEALTLRAAVDSKNINTVEYYWQQLTLTEQQKQTLCRALYINICLNGDKNDKSVKDFLKSKLQ